MIEKYYEDAPDQFKSAWLNENNPKGLIIKFVDYKRKVNPAQGDNPKTNGWYEHNDKAKNYILTEDTSVVEGKLYFEQVSDNLALTYTDRTIEDDSFKLKRSLQSGSDIDFMGCVASSLEFKVENDFKYIKDQKLYAELTVTEEETLWKIRVFTGIVEEVKRDKSRDMVRTVTAYDFLHRLLDNYDVTDWYVWIYGEKTNSTDPDERIKHTMFDLRNTFWNFIANEGTEYSPDEEPVEIHKKGTGWDQVQDASLVNDSLEIPKTLNVNPVDYDNEIVANRIGGSPNFEKGKPADIIADWDVSDLVARKQVIDIGVNTGAEFHYYWKVVTPVGNENPMVEGWYEYVDGEYVLSQDSTVIAGKTYYSNSEYLGNYRAYMAECDKIFESTGNPLCGIQAHIDQIPKEDQEKVRETQITASTVLQAICQFNGVFGVVNGNGRFEYIKLDNSNPLDIEEEYQIEVGHSDLQMPKITGVVIFDKTSEEYSSDTIHTEYGDTKNGKKGSALAYYPNDRTKIEGDTANPFTIDDNFLMNSYNQRDARQMAANLYNNIVSLSMRNCDITIKAMPWLKVGQPISFYAPTENTLYPAEDLYPSESLYPRDYEKIVTLMLNIEISGTGLLKEKIECKVEGLKGDIVSLNEVISDEMFQRTIGNSRLYSVITQTADKIESKVVDLDKGISSRITQLADEIDLEINGEGGIRTLIQLNSEGILFLGERITNECVSYEVYADDKITLNAKLIEMEANEAVIKAEKVSFVDLSKGGRTVINGANIMTGTISCDRIKMSQITIGTRTYTIKWATESVIGFDYLNYGLEEISVVVLDATNPITVTRNGQGLVTDVTLNTHTMDVARFVPSGSTNVPKAYSINNIAASQFVYLGSEPEIIT